MVGANFQLSDLPVGVYPFTPIAHTWTLNGTIGAKIHCKGFSMVPDVASTAFLMQGSSLDAMVADCGDLGKRYYLPDMTTAYASLSIPQEERRRFAALTNVCTRFVPSKRSSWTEMLDEIVAVTFRQRIWSMQEDRRVHIHGMTCKGRVHEDFGHDFKN